MSRFQARLNEEMSKKREGLKREELAPKEEIVKFISWLNMKCNWVHISHSMADEYLEYLEWMEKRRSPDYGQ